MTKVHVDDLIGCHVVGCSKPAKHWFVTKLCPEIYTKEEYLRFSLKSLWMQQPRRVIVSSLSKCHSCVWVLILKENTLSYLVGISVGKHKTEKI